MTSYSIFSDPNESKSLLSQLECGSNYAMDYFAKRLGKLARVTSWEEYELLQKVGQGTFGEVFKARHRKSKQHFALKRIKTEEEREGVSFPIPYILCLSFP